MIKLEDHIRPLKRLIDGEHPTSGEQIEERLINDEPTLEFLRSLLLAVESHCQSAIKPMTDKHRERNRIAGWPLNSGLMYSVDDLEGVHKDFKDGVFIDDIAQKYERTEQSIIDQLAKSLTIRRVDAFDLLAAQRIDADRVAKLLAQKNEH